MTARQKGDQGSVLIFVLIVVTVMALATMAVAKLGFTVPKAAAEHTSNQRVSDALETGLNAGVEKLRTTATNACPSPSTFTVNDIDGQSASSGGVQPAINAAVACATTANPNLLTLTVTCNGAPGPTLVGNVSVAKVGDDSAPPLLITSRNFTNGTGSAGC